MKLYYESKPGELEHGLFSKLFKPKYLKKIPIGNGKFRYLYTQEEVDAYNKANAERRKAIEAYRQTSIADKRDKAYKERSVNERLKELGYDSESISKMSKEYKEELAYNSKKSSVSNSKKSSVSNGSKKTTSNATNGKMSKEYYEELENNSRKNDYSISTRDSEKVVNVSRPYTFTYDEKSGKTTVEYTDPKKKKKK